MAKRQGKNTRSASTVAFILGAGFSKCSDLPLQSEFSGLLLSDDFNTEIDIVITQSIKRFVKDVFGWSEGRELPSLEDIFTCIDLSAQTGHNLGIKYTPKKLRAIRRMAIYRIFSVLDKRFSYSEDIGQLLRKFCSSSESNTSFIVLNWDIVLEKHLLLTYPGVDINYHCECRDWNNPDVIRPNSGISVCKMHGSSNWVYCDNCKSLFFDLEQKLSLRTKAGLIKSDFRLFDTGFTDKKFDAAIAIPPSDRECRFCSNLISSHIATFSYRKSFRNPAYQSIWYHAEKLLSDSNRWVFIGYSLPEADYELKHLLKAAQLRMAHVNRLNKRMIDVVVQENKWAINKFEKFFGNTDVISFYNDGLSGYVSRVCPV